MLIWMVAFSPSIAFLIVPWNDRWGGLATALGIAQGPFLFGAALIEFLWLRKSNQDASVTSKTGNAIAVVLGVAIIALFAWILI
jgi:hypothetical protein